ncbi:MAG: hypothetical protein N2316_08535 [Spirochaetes bacterium]|nr:hypothetical protein [Spirochaetota bacterium]
MKKANVIFLYFVFFTMKTLFSQTQMDDNQHIGEAPIKEDKYESAMKVWIQDSRALQNIVKPLRKYKLSYSDTDLIRNEKKDQLHKALREINRKYKNVELRLQCVRNENVEEEKVLSEYGRQKSQKIIYELKKHPHGKFIFEMGKDPKENVILSFYLGLMLAFCKKCFQTTGHFIASYVVPIPNKNSSDIYDNLFSKFIWKKMM